MLSIGEHVMVRNSVHNVSTIYTEGTRLIPGISGHKHIIICRNLGWNQKGRTTWFICHASTHTVIVPFQVELNNLRAYPVSCWRRRGTIGTRWNCTLALDSSVLSHSVSTHDSGDTAGLPTGPKKLQSHTPKTENLFTHCILFPWPCVLRIAVYTLTIGSRHWKTRHPGFAASTVFHPPKNLAAMQPPQWWSTLDLDVAALISSPSPRRSLSFVEETYHIISGQCFGTSSTVPLLTLTKWDHHMKSYKVASCLASYIHICWTVITMDKRQQTSRNAVGRNNKKYHCKNCICTARICTAICTCEFQLLPQVIVFQSNEKKAA